MVQKLIIFLLLVNIILLNIIPINICALEGQWWNSSWSFRQEVVIPIDTNTEIAKYQPIDVYIEFSNKCWAKNEYEHSIRVILQDGEFFKELDSQIYDLKYNSENHIQACNLVFLIPEEANGKESYFIYYDNKEKNAPEYEDHVNIEESYYHFEPIPGYPFESNYFKIIEDDFIVYAVSQEGTFMGYTTSQHVTKLKEKTTEVLPKYGDLITSFDFRYYYGQDMMDYCSTSRALVSKEIMVDGNLMVEFGIVSKTGRNDVQTSVIYKYYYNPSDNNRIQAHVEHHVSEEINIAYDSNSDGDFVRMQCGGVTSKSIKDLNFGEILPYLHIYNEMDIIDELNLDLDPEYTPEDYSIRVLNYDDDVDLGTQAWVSFDEGEYGISHSIIFSSNSVLKSGIDERDGIQLKSFEMDYPHLPGIETNRAILDFGRNSYEKGGVHDLVIPQGFHVEFDVEFFSSDTGGYRIVQEEAIIFQSLSKIKPSWDKEILDEIDKKEGHFLSVFVHFSYSFPLGAALSALTGLEFSYINVELYKDQEQICSGTPVRFRFNSELKDSNIFKKIFSAFYPVDWKNLSIFKKIRFDDIDPGRYVIRVFRENPFLKKDRKYIGFKTIDVKEDTKTHIFCTSEGLVRISVVDINNKAVEGSEAYLLKDNEIIAKNTTDSSGKTLIKAPISNIYDLQVVYNGFIVSEKKVKLNLISRFLPIRKAVKVERHGFKLKIVDTWDLPPSIELNPYVLSNKMNEPTLLSPTRLSSDIFLFTNLIPSIYQLNLRYKSFSIEEDIDIPSEKEISVVFPAEFDINLNTLDARGVTLPDAKIIVSRGGKNIDLLSKTSESLISLPPGVYNVDTYYEDDLIGSRKINILGERSFDLITTNEPLYPYIVTLFAIIISILSFIFSYYQRNFVYFLKILTVSLAMVATIFPWWMIHGATSQIETSTKLFVLPLNLVTITISNGVIGGELAFLPDVFIDVVSLISFFTLFGCLLIFGSIIIKRFNKKLYSLSLLLTLLFFICSIVIFYLAMSQFAEIGIGSFIGSGNLDINIPGETLEKSIICNWGPTTGFFVYVISIITLLLIIVLKKKRIFK